MTTRILVDSSFLVAQLDARDTHHKTARDIDAAFQRRDVTYIYLDVVVNETVTVLARRAVERGGDPVSVIRRIRAELPPQRLDWTGPELPRLWNDVLTEMETMKGRLSFHDCLLAVVAREGGLEWVASFDRNFDHVSGLKRVGTVAAFEV